MTFIHQHTFYTMRRLLLLLYLPALLSAQARHDYQWLLGDLPNDPGTKSGGVLMDFNVNPPRLNYYSVGAGSSYSYQPLCDEKGVLQFYTNGCAVLNRENNLMLNGDGISPGSFRRNYCIDGGYPTQQLCLPFPGRDSLYAIFYTTYDDIESYISTLYITTVDMRQNAGLGAVIDKNSRVSYDTLDVALCAVKHGNGRDWWVTVGNNTTHAALLGPGGIERVVSNDGASFEGTINGQACFSPDGRWYCHHTGRRVNLYHFDRCTGLFDLQTGWDMPTDSVWGIMGGIAVSPNSRLLYVTTGAAVHQFDLEATDIAASDSLIYRAYAPGEPIRTTFYQLQLAPDGKIYGMPFSQTTRLHVIRQPDLRGRACELAPQSVELPAKNWIALPYFPNYRLGAQTPGPCDTLTPPPPALLQVSPNPADAQIEIATGAPARGPVL